MTATLHEIRLPAGDYPPINIGWFGGEPGALNLDPEDWLTHGYKGVRIIGEGTDKTHVRPQGWRNDGRAIAVGRHPGIVQIENLSYYAGPTAGISFGEQNTAKELLRKFRLNLYGCRGVVPPPTEEGRSKWLNFGYQADAHVVDCEFDAEQSAEHAWYWHGTAGKGILWARNKVIASGAECFKIRSDETETAWAGPNVKILILDCEFANWHQEHSHRGGGGIVLQGAAADVRIERNVFRPGPALASVQANARAHCIMVSSEGGSYDILTGKVDVGFGNGSISIRQNAMEGQGVAPGWHDQLINIYRAGGSQLAARSVEIEQLSAWGEGYTVTVTDVPSNKTAIHGCNTPELRDFARSKGMRAEHEATFPTSQRRVPLSEGIER